MALKNGTLVVVNEELIKAVDYALKLRMQDEHQTSMRRRRSTVNDSGLVATAEEYHGGFMCSCDPNGLVTVRNHDDSTEDIAGWTTSGRAFWSYSGYLPSYGNYCVWAVLYHPAGRQYIYVRPVDYPIINQYGLDYVLIAEVTYSENGCSVTQIFKDDRIDDSQHAYTMYEYPFQLTGTVTGSSGNYQVSLSVHAGCIYHSTSYSYDSGLVESVDMQNINLPDSEINVYLLYKRSSPGDARFIVAKDCILNEPKEYILKFVGTITKNQYGGYNLINDFVGDIYDTVTRNSTFNAYQVSTITETTADTGIVLTETVTGWEVTAGQIEYTQYGNRITLPTISGDFPLSGAEYKYATLTYDPSTGQYSATWTDQAPTQQDIYTWGQQAISISSSKTVHWVMTAPDFESGKIIVRDRWQ